MEKLELKKSVTFNGGIFYLDKSNSNLLLIEECETNGIKWKAKYSTKEVFEQNWLLTIYRQLAF